ncbi:MAG TPA: hypothetical protein VD838_05860 [Anaeromyxobacteraceae bacterium]|nr:hypothetical protein [Anaeromyxobacteraceae bacterium]
MKKRTPAKPAPPHPDTTLWEFQQATRAYAQLLEQPYPANNLDSRLAARIRIDRATRAHLEAWQAELPKERARQAELEARRAEGNANPENR